MQEVLLSRTTVTLDDGKGHLDKYQIVVFNSIYHKTKFKSNRFINICMYANVSIFDIVNITAIIFLLSLNFTDKK